MKIRTVYVSVPDDTKYQKEIEALVRQFNLSLFKAPLHCDLHLAVRTVQDDDQFENDFNILTAGSKMVVFTNYYRVYDRYKHRKITGGTDVFPGLRIVSFVGSNPLQIIQTSLELLQTGNLVEGFGHLD